LRRVRQRYADFGPTLAAEHLTFICDQKDAGIATMPSLVVALPG